MKTKGRFWEIDFIKGIAIIMMIILHWFWSLDYFNITGFSISSGLYKPVQIVTAGIFILFVGINLSISYSRTNRGSVWKKYIKRGLKTIGYGLIVTLGSYFVFGSHFIKFGILHFIGLSIMLAIPFLSYKKINLVLGSAVIATGLLIKNITVSSDYLVWIGLTSASFSSADYFPLLPWFGLVLIGIFLGQKLYRKNQRRFSLIQQPYVAKPFCVLGKHSLLIYFIHMIIILGIIFAIKI